MSVPFVNISRLRFSSDDPAKQLIELKDAVAKFEVDIYKNSDISALQAQITEMQTTIQGLLKTK